MCFLFTMSMNPLTALCANERNSRNPDKLSSRPAKFGSTKSGGARRDRTDDLMLAKHALSQLSYGPVMAPTHSPKAGTDHILEETAGGGWWAWEDLNFRPHAYQARALTN